MAIEPSCYYSAASDCKVVVQIEPASKDKVNTAEINNNEDATNWKDSLPVLHSVVSHQCVLERDLS